MSDTLAFVFPGQGSQAVGMLGGLSVSYAQIKNTFDEASDALGRNIWAMTQEGPAHELNLTQNTQPAILTASVALWRVWQSISDVRPSSMAGDSLGEYSALVCAGSLDFVDAVKLVEQRAAFMQQAAPKGEGAMAAILGLELSILKNVCKQAAGDEVVSAVNYNAPGQVVIAGNTAAVNRAIELAKIEGAKRALLLPVSVPSHCELMVPAAKKIMHTMSTIEFAAPTIPVVHNTDVAEHQKEASIKEALSKQLYTPVRWTESVEALINRNTTTIIECGPGKVLTGLNKRINKSLALYSIGDEVALNKTLEAFS